MPALERLHHDPTLTVYALGNLCIAVWRDAPKKGQVAMVQHSFFSQAGKHGHLALVNLIVSGTPNFTEDTRQEAKALQHDKRGKIHATAYVILVGGFAGAATRAFISGVTLLTRTKSHTRVFADIPSSVRWLEGEIPKVPGVSWRIGELLENLVRAAATPP